MITLFPKVFLMRNKKSLGNKVICVIFAKSMMQLKGKFTSFIFFNWERKGKFFARCRRDSRTSAMSRGGSMRHA